MNTQMEKEQEVRNRILLSIAAYAYEYESHSVISDAEYDLLSYKINTTIVTGNSMLDIFFREEFTPYTGQWVHKHPEIPKLKYIYDTVYKGEKQ